MKVGIVTHYPLGEPRELPLLTISIGNENTSAYFMGQVAFAVEEGDIFECRRRTAATLRKLADLFDKGEGTP